LHPRIKVGARKELGEFFVWRDMPLAGQKFWKVAEFGRNLNQSWKKLLQNFLPESVSCEWDWSKPVGK
jgi:hypothetical protein